MRSGKSYFNKTVFLKNITRFWPVWALYLAYLILTMPVGLTGMISKPDSGYTAVDIGFALLRSECSFFSVAIDAVFSLATAMAVFSFMYTPRSAYSMASLPCRRESVFSSCALSGLLWLIGANVIAALITCVMELSGGLFDPLYIVQWLGMAAMRILLFYGLACLCAQLTGSIVILPLVYVLFNFLAVWLETLVNTFFRLFVYGLSTGSGALPCLLSPLITITSSRVKYCDPSGMDVAVNYASGTYVDGAGIERIASIRYDGWTALIIYAAAGIVMLAGALLLYRSRRMESAGDVVAVRVLKPVFKYCMAFGCALVIGLLLYSLVFDFTPMPLMLSVVLGFLIGGFIGYFAASMLIKKTFRVFRGGWLGFIVFSVITVALIFAADMDIFGYERYVPSPERVESLSVAVDNGVTVTDKDDILEFTELHSRIVSTGDPGYSGSDASVSFSYTLTNGSHVTRRYDVRVTDEELADITTAAYKLNELWNRPDIILKRLEPSIPVTTASITYGEVYSSDKENGDTDAYVELTPAQAYELYTTCILPDIADGALGKTYFIGDGDIFYNTSIRFELYKRAPNGYYSNGAFEVESDQSATFYINPTANSSRTNAYLAALGITP